MGFLDNVKKIKGAVEQVTNIAQQLTTNQTAPQKAVPVVSEVIDEGPAAVIEDGKMVISSVNQMSSWLGSISPANPSAVTMKVLDSQLEVIKFVQAPSLLGMVLDNMIATLYQTLKQVEDEREKEKIRDVMAVMIQNLIFFSDAQLRYAIDSNKQQAKQLLGHAGDMLAKSVVSAATLVGGA